MSVPDDLRARARAWIEADPDPDSRAALAAALAADDLAELEAAFRAPLAFGTAGLRGPVGPGPARMNRATVIRTTRGLADHLLAADASGPVVVGFDARPDSPAFARDAVGVLAAAGLEVRWFPRPVPTPLVAYAAKVLEAAAAVVVTASHNPPADNGYKVYGPDARQIVTPADVEIAAATAAVGPADRVPRGDPDTAPGVEPLGDELATSYLAELAAARPVVRGPSPRLAYTPLHGVGGELALRALADAGHHDVHVVDEQFTPDGTFPTVAFPNPEEPGALDAALALADDVAADLVLANDPDADRLAVAAPRGGARVLALTGNQLGVLLGDHLLRHTDATRAVVVSSVVSTPMFAAVAAAHGARHEHSRTGFKWICRAGAAVARAEDRDFVLGFEEALGYAVGTVVGDKDGIGAAVVAADLARELAAEGRDVHDRLAELYDRHGLWVGHQASVPVPAAVGEGAAGRALDALVAASPTRLGGRAVVEVVDHRVADADRPPWRSPTELVEVRLDDGRALLRPSGTEPKVKCYVDLRAARHGPLGTQEAQLQATATAVARDLVAAAGLV